VSYADDGFRVIARATEQEKILPGLSEAVPGKELLAAKSI